MSDPDTVVEYNRLRAAGAEPGDAAATVGAIDAVWKGRRAMRLGIDIHNPAELAAFANIGLTVAVWRNTALENLHSGWDDSGTKVRVRLPATTDRAADDTRTRSVAEQVALGGGIPDDTMLRLNTWTQHQMASHLTSGKADLAAAQALLLDPDRVLQIGDAAIRAGDFFGKEFAELTESISEACERLAQHASREGEQALVYALAISGLSYASGWWGTPYWADTVGRLPSDVLDAPARQLLTRTPWLLTSGHTDQLVWTRPFEDAKADAKRAWFSDRESTSATLLEAFVT